MGMYFGATLCIGVVVYEEGEELNSSFVSSMYEELEDFDLFLW